VDFFRTLAARTAALFRRRRLDAELEEELRAHIELAVAENMHRGMTAADARTAALRDFGGVTQIRESYRLQRGMPMAQQLLRDLKFALRQLRKSPGFALTAIVTLALGLGANTAVFSLINGLLLKPLAVPHSEELVAIHYTRSDETGQNYALCTPLFRAVEARHDIFQSVGAYYNAMMQVRAVAGNNNNVEVTGAFVSGDYFSTLQMQPLLGRVLTAQDDQHGGASTGFAAVISEGFWRSWFNGAPDIIGRRLTIANTAFTVVGVMPARFHGFNPTRWPLIYIPMTTEPIVDAPQNALDGGYYDFWLHTFARRAPGVTLEQANAALAAASVPMLDGTVTDNSHWIKDAREKHFQILADPGATGFSYLRAEFIRPLTAVFAMCGAMLLLACLNLASLLMARAAARERELATRLALGATRRRLMQQLLVESLLIALLGTAAGLAAAPAVSRTLRAFLIGHGGVASLDVSLDLHVFLFVAISAVAATLLVGLIPALRATGSSLNEQIKNSSHATSARERRRVLPGILMALEVALALVLVVGAGLLTSSLTRLYRTGMGFDPKGVVDLRFDMGKQALEGDALLLWYRNYGEGLSHEPGVRSVSFSSETPLSGDAWTTDFHNPFSGGAREVAMNMVAPGYFRTMRIAMLAGRDFTWDDIPASGSKIILNQTAANYFFPGQNPVGQQIRGDHGNAGDAYEVIAVVADTREADVRRAAPAAAYAALTQNDDRKPSYTAVVRVDGSAAPLAAAARALAAKMAPDIPAPRVTTLSGDLDENLGIERMMAMLAGYFAACALLVTAIGLYGTLAYSTARRTSEIGIRMALGAQRGQVLLLIFRENSWIAAAGSLAGLVLAMLGSRALASFLYGTSVRDPWVFAGSVGILMAVASAASIVPALKASRIEPIAALRAE